MSSVFLGWSVLLFLSPAFLYWFIHGSRERYLWIIEGPEPFRYFGSGPYQLWMSIGLVGTAVLFLMASFAFSILRKRYFEREKHYE
ncbi:hypothetical protein EQV77_06725 [Halobacillus fulvus]|nr:hypothetical protein EQV77_06725 [Halobacillus fulvus]